MDMTEYINTVSALFNNSSWIVHDRNNTWKSKLEKAINLGERLSDDTREMMVFLFQKFIILHQNNYTNLLLDSLDLIDVNTYSKYTKYYVIPIKQEKDIGSKSGTTISYLFKTDDIHYHPIFSNKTINEVTFNSIPQNINISPIKKLLLVDDFIGSGQSSIELLTEINKHVNVTPDKVAFIFLAGMNDGINKLKKIGYEVYCNICQNKGISDITDTNLKSKYTKLMQALEDDFKFSVENRFGYQKSEALITLERTPNNTFPIFWDYERNINAPFRRYK